MFLNKWKVRDDGFVSHCFLWDCPVFAPGGRQNAMPSLKVR